MLDRLKETEYEKETRKARIQKISQQNRPQVV